MGTTNNDYFTPLSKEDEERFLQIIWDAVPEATWQTPEDLGRMSFEALVAENNSGRVLNSKGELHLTGKGVTGHQAPLKAVADVMKDFQSLIDAAGAKIKGLSTIAGKLPAEVTEFTCLNLQTAPQPGSLRLLITPAKSATEELPEDRALPGMEESEDQLTDQAMNLAIDLFTQGLEAGPVADSFAEKVQEQGPRVASALKKLATTLSDANFDTDIAWEQPGAPTRRVHLKEADCTRIASIITGRELDEQQTVIIGTVDTISVGKTSLIIEDAQGVKIRIERGDLSDKDLEGVTVNERVHVEVIEKLVKTSSGLTKSEYRALKIVPLT